MKMVLARYTCGSSCFATCPRYYNLVYHLNAAGFVAQEPRGQTL